jgi:CDP-glycerol glycerophosphotransferase (TagB/SpsB family)
VSPSWGPSSLFEVFGTQFIATLASRFDVIVRPHPQMKISQPGRQAEILAITGVTVDTAPTPEDSMARADIMITDYSGIQHEFAFIHEKPVITVEHNSGMSGFEGHLFGGTSKIREGCREFIVQLSPAEIDSLGDRVEQVLAQHNSAKIAKARDELVYNFGHAGDAAAAQLEELLRCL